jgi:hypothetical protein
MLWAAAILVASVASLLLWWVGGQAACGQEVYDTPPGSFGDAFCRDLVEPVFPWGALAGLPLLVVLVVGLAGIRTRSTRLLVVAVVAPLAVAFLAVAAALAAF